ncbi:Hok/Gef family protein [Salmonella enterica]|uniref:Hok/Gef family protein n=3 Tax=Salmonella enterica TaxID=28901 RepID=A0A6Y2K5L0_SALER|nr:Hok/Gef family protein [Salmonella enterica subsp. arizonae]EAN3420266.1 Hok/Gef family protein [Salmonella enterica]ECK9491326.1 Hok/Gef family protein [Salmonella enterica subsp. arizonae str. CFSAN000561]EDT2801859.1 Hok/Gef family protein [Salmonella enterica subsp. arizonae serovar 62:z4,z23:-]EDW7124462.1 Hok/Gef family protein [Salmonella enterica subsp. enterica serovar Waycross]EDX7568160.1 Hok/Gef family protein [Salmonella enterica subsp. arizonae serovar 41:z4,z23:-]
MLVLVSRKDICEVCLRSDHTEVALFTTAKLSKIECRE